MKVGMSVTYIVDGGLTISGDERAKSVLGSFIDNTDIQTRNGMRIRLITLNTYE